MGVTLRTPFASVPAWRVVAARHPPIHLFEDVADASEFDALYELEAAFSPHHDELRLLQHLPRSEWVYGPGSGYVMAPFAYRSPSRFSNGDFGIFYAGLDEATAIAEVGFHRGVFMARTHEPPSVLEEQVLGARVTGNLVDIRGQATALPLLYAPDPAAYVHAQAFGASLHEASEEGLAYDSVRRPGGACVGILRPRRISGCRQIRLLKYVWDGSRIAGWV